MNGAGPQLAEIAALWNKIEGRAKEAEQFRGEAILASINEMRYAGRRIVDALAALNAPTPPADLSDFVQEQLIVAKTYLINADHDITDSICFFAHERFRRTIDQHGRKKIRKHCPEFDALYPAIEEAHEIVRGSREDRVRRKAEYERLEREYVPRIKELYAKLSDNPKLRLLDPERWTRRKLNLIQWLVILGAIANIVGFTIAHLISRFWYGGLPS